MSDELGSAKLVGATKFFAVLDEDSYGQCMGAADPPYTITAGRTINQLSAEHGLAEPKRDELEPQINDEQTQRLRREIMASAFGEQGLEHGGRSGVYDQVPLDGVGGYDDRFSSPDSWEDQSIWARNGRPATGSALTDELGRGAGDYPEPRTTWAGTETDGCEPYRTGGVEHGND